jgi:hypothetical protein
MHFTFGNVAMGKKSLQSKKAWGTILPVWGSLLLLSPLLSEASSFVFVYIYLYSLVIHDLDKICMEKISQGNFLCSYLYLKQEKCHISVFFFLIFLFSSAKLENRRAEKVLPRE